ncbi:MAG: DUF3788 family protein [Bacteroidetes bacterium]|nr:DUF3788 family protein [Bacteroidota bacterium]
MSELLDPRLTDPAIRPDDELIESLIGKKIIFWKAIQTHTEASYKDVSGDWNYYKDGKQWLFKCVQKKKTLFWAALFGKSFRITFYFGDQAEQILVGSDIPEPMKEGFINAKRFGAIRPITVVISGTKGC